MSRFKRFLSLIVPCSMLLFSSLPAVNAATLTSPFSGGALQTYWGKYYSGATTSEPVAQPTTPQPTQTATQPTTTQPTNTQPATNNQPTTTQPTQTTTQPASPQQSISNSSTSFPTYWNKYYGGSIATIPGIQPTTTQPTTTQPTTTQPTTTQPTTTQPTTTTSPTTTQPTSDTSGLSADEQQMLDLVNQARVSAGLPAYTVDMRLVNLARMKCQDMVQNNYFNHISPTYGSPYDMEVKAGVSARVMGAENIAEAATTQRAFELFMGSPDHKANILNPQHTLIGIGIVKTSTGVVVSQLFLGN